MTTKAVKSKEEFQAKQAEMKLDFNKKKKNPNHRVTPNLTPRGRDILRRLQNKSLDTTGEKSYTLNEEMVNTRMMNKHELRATAERNSQKIEDLKRSLEEKAILAKKAEHAAKLKEEQEKISKSKKEEDDK